MKRRDFITILGGAAVGSSILRPLAARAQQPMSVIGFLDPESTATRDYLLAAVRQGLAETGHVVGQTIRIDSRWADGHFDRLRGLAAELVNAQVKLIVASGATSAVAARAATTTIPVVFYIGSDPIELGLVASFNRPGGNATGVTQLSNPLELKRLELLHQLLPNTPAIAVLVHADAVMGERNSINFQEAARAIGVPVLVLNVSNEHDIDAAFEMLLQKQAGGVLIGSGSFFNSRRKQIIALAARHHVPASFARREDVEAGALMSYGGVQTDAFRLVGIYAGRVLNGEKPADLPVVQPTKFELLINLKTAKALGIEFPATILALADAVIE